MFFRKTNWLKPALNSNKHKLARAEIEENFYFLLLEKDI